jgi:hypothetical protein
MIKMRDKATFIYKLYIFLIIAGAIVLIYFLFDKALKEYFFVPSTEAISTTTRKTKSTTTTE